MSKKPFKLLIVLITYNRLNYTKKTLKTLRHTIDDTTDYFIVAVDNNSTDGTQQYLRSCNERGLIDEVICNPENYYPGKACNIGYQAGLELYSDATHLMRLDNDMQLKKGWDLAIRDYFNAIPELGQLGYDHEAIEDPRADLNAMTINGKTVNPYPGCIGGPSVIRRRVWDDGLRYDETPWTNDGYENIVHEQEDYRFSKAIQEAGWLFGHMQEEFGRTFANKGNWHEYPDYYKKTMAERGYKGEYAFLWEDEK